MNIGEAKQEIKNTITAYLQRNADGEYCFPIIRQRPLLLMGPPGIGKTAVMEQIAEELRIGFVSYTMTHHTRQSAVGLPQIVEQKLEGDSFSVTRYTMSEIIAAVYSEMEENGHKEGILFLDEINCVSDTLAPTMLQFLQNKTFGSHALPQGWIIVSAGNPPEYNKSVREFDIATLDRIRTISIQPDTEVFLEYAESRGIHTAVVSFLKLYPDRFYHASHQDGQKRYVTARGWEDLSALLYAYEALNISVTEEVVSEFICLPETSRTFYAFYRLYCKNCSDYAVSELLSGELADASEKAKMLQKADFVERFAVIQMLLHGIGQKAKQYAREDEIAVNLHEALKCFLGKNQPLSDFIFGRRRALETKQNYRLLTEVEIKKEQRLLEQLGELEAELHSNHITAAEEICRQATLFLGKQLQLRKEKTAQLHIALHEAITWLRAALGTGRELTALLAGITSDPVIMGFIAQHGCDDYLTECSCLQTTMDEARLRAACAAAGEGRPESFHS